MSEEIDSESDKWDLKAFIEMLRRQIAEMEETKSRLQRRGENPDDNAALFDAMLEIRAFRTTLAGLEDELQREIDDGTNDEGKTND